MTTSPTHASGGTKGHVVAVLVSDGGVPKLPIERTSVGPNGLQGDRQRHPSIHGGPEQAVCLLTQDVIDALQAEGHPIAAGTTGENVTLGGIPGRALRAGVRLRFEGGLCLELNKPAEPCSTIRASFADQKLGHLLADNDPARTRHYARVIVEGDLWTGQGCTLEAPASGTTAAEAAPIPG